MPELVGLTAGVPLEVALAEAEGFAEGVALVSAEADVVAVTEGEGGATVSTVGGGVTSVVPGTVGAVTLVVGVVVSGGASERSFHIANTIANVPNSSAKITRPTRELDLGFATRR